jgi:hypothetical protein
VQGIFFFESTSPQNLTAGDPVFTGISFATGSVSGQFLKLNNNDQILAVGFRSDGTSDVFLLSPTTITPPGGCTPPQLVQVDNTGAFGAYEAVVRSIQMRPESTTVALSIQPTVLDLPFLPNRTLRFWVSIDNISFDSTAVRVESDSSDSLGVIFADLRLFAPGTQATFLAHFCRPASVAFTLGRVNPRAITLTLADMIFPLVAIPSPSTVLSFIGALTSIPLYASATNHMVAGLSAVTLGQIGVAFSELSKAGVDLVKLASNSKQRTQLRQAFQTMGITVTVSELMRALLRVPARIIEVSSDFIALSIQTGFGSEPIIVKVIAPL